MDCRGGFPSRGAGFPGGRGGWGGHGGRGAGGHGGRGAGGHGGRGGGMFGLGHPHFGFDRRFDPRFGFGFGGPAAGGPAASSATQCPLGYGSAGFQEGPWGPGPEVGVAGLRGLLTHAAPYLQRIVGDIDEQMIEQAIQASLAEATGPQNGTGQQFKETVTVDKCGEKEIYRVDIVLGGDAKAESLKIKRKDNIVTIDVKTETSAEDGSSRLYQEYTRRITLPENVDLTQLESALSPDGVLTIKAPLFPKPEEVIQSVPIAVVTLD